jgi:hypothetical protein
MKTFILLGEKAILDFENQDWKALENSVLEDFNGDLIAWNKETDSVSELLEQLRGWNDFIELSQQDLKDIEANTKIEILW